MAPRPKAPPPDVNGAEPTEQQPPLVWLTMADMQVIVTLLQRVALDGQEAQGILARLMQAAQ